MTAIPDGFLRDILADPADDVPRLILADWLDENGDPDRAGFVRGQVELASLRRPDGSARLGVLLSRPAGELERRNRELLDTHGDAWFRADRGLSSGHPVERNAWYYRHYLGLGRVRYWLGFDRGLLGRFHGPAADFIDHGPQLFARLPLTEVSLSDWEPDFEGGVYWLWRGNHTLKLWRGNHTLNGLGPSYVPFEIFNHLDEPHVLGKNGIYRDTREAALDALCTAAVRWGREKAGLPALTNTPPPG